jgi:hypothetical protein
MEIYDIVKKLIGPIEPIGETNSDEQRFKNLENMIDLTGKLLSDIIEVSQYEKCEQHSMSKAGKLARQFMIDFTI